MNWFDEVDYGNPQCEDEGMRLYRERKTPHTVFLALSGKKQVGKDTAANMILRLMEAENRSVAITAFAEPLKRMCVEILGIKHEGAFGTDADKNALSHIMWDGFPLDVRLKYSKEIDQLDGKMLPRLGPMTNREVLQVMGTDVFRAIYGDVWAKAPFNRDWSGYDLVVLTDCRFPNEKKVTEDAGGVIIRLERSTGFVDNHPSEIALDGFEFENTYANNGSLEDLEKYIRYILARQGLING